MSYIRRTRDNVKKNRTGFKVLASRKKVNSVRMLGLLGHYTLYLPEKLDSGHCHTNLCAILLHGNTLMHCKFHGKNLNLWRPPSS